MAALVEKSTGPRTRWRKTPYADGVSAANDEEEDDEEENEDEVQCEWRIEYG